MSIKVYERIKTEDLERHKQLVQETNGTYSKYDPGTVDVSVVFKTPEDFIEYQRRMYALKNQ